MDQEVFLIITFAVISVVSSINLQYAYHSHQEITSFLRDISATYPDITRLYTIGESVQGRPLYVLALGSRQNESTLLRPHVKYVANMHGNEVIGREALLHFINDIVPKYSSNQTVRDFLDTTVLHIMPTMNPDGFVIAEEGDCRNVTGRFNANMVDLNRNFPNDFENSDNQASTQIETEAVMKWLKQYQFVLSANLHGGALLVNYPYDTYANATSSKYAESPDDDVFRQISLIYSRSNHRMHQQPGCQNETFGDGITNGADWYPIEGGMQDYNYREAGCMEVTIELSCCKYPLEVQLQSFVRENLDALLLYIMQVHTGIKGVVRDLDNNPVDGAVVTIVNREPIHSKTTSDGEYWRILLPGSYEVKATSGNMEGKVKVNVVGGAAQQSDIVLDTVSPAATLTVNSCLLLLITLTGYFL